DEPQMWRGTLVTDATDTRPVAIQFLPGSTYIPFWAAIGTLVAAVGVLAKAYIMSVFGGGVLIASLAVWLLPREATLITLRESDLPARTGLPVMSSGSSAVAWWGMVGLLTIIGAMF